LLRQLLGRPLETWDRSKTDRSRLVAEFVAAQPTAWRWAYLPANAPELNPVTCLWAIGTSRAAQLLSARLHPINVASCGAPARMHRRPALVMGFWEQAELSPLSRYFAKMDMSQHTLPAACTAQERLSASIASFGTRFGHCGIDLGDAGARYATNGVT
jgi:hypothetical protein